MGCDVPYSLSILFILVSIHAPTWDATYPHFHSTFILYVSIHAPTWDATVSAWLHCLPDEFQSTHPHGMRQISALTLPIYFLFQSTHPHGMRLGLSLWVDIRDNVSIHAPTWDATCAKYHFSVVFAFQSTHPHGMRHFAPIHFAPVFLFQSTHPHGMRPSLSARVKYHESVSIHAPTWDATHVFCYKVSPYAVSIHAPTWDATIALN